MTDHPYRVFSVSIAVFLILGGAAASEPVTAAPLSLPAPPADNWQLYYEIDFRDGWNDGHWTRINGQTPYIDCNLNHGTTDAQGGIETKPEGLRFWASNANAPNTLYTNNVLPPTGDDFYARWKIKWTMKYEGWGMGFYFGTQPYDDETYYEHPSYCRDVLGPLTDPYKRIANLQGDHLDDDEIDQWFVVAVAYDAATRTATHYSCDANGHNCTETGTQTLPENEYPVSFHIGHILRPHLAGNFQTFIVQYLQIFHDPAGEMTVTVRNPEGDPVARPLGGATWDSWWGWVLNATHDLWGTYDTYTDIPPDIGDKDYQGAYVDLQADDVPMWGDTDISDNGSSGSVFYSDGNGDGDSEVYAGWVGGLLADESLDLVIATQTPTPTPTNTPSPTPTNTPSPTPTNTPSPTPTNTPTPTPYLQVNVENPEGTPVAVAEIAIGDDENSMVCSDCDQLERGTDNLAARIFAGIRRLANQILWDWSTTADNATLTEGDTEDTLAMDNWDTGSEEVNFVVVTPTPTPTPQDVPPHDFELDHIYVYPDDFCTYIVGGVYADDHALEDVWVQGVVTTTQARVIDVAATAARRYIPQGDGSCFKITLCDLVTGEEIADYDLGLSAVPAYRTYPYVRAYAIDIEGLGGGYALAEGVAWVDEASAYPTADNVSVVLWGWDVANQQVTSCDAVGVGHLEQEEDPVSWNAYIRSANTYYYRTTSNPH